MSPGPVLQIVDAGGEPFARGRAIGLALAPRIAAHLEAWQAWLARVTRMPAGAYVEGMLQATSFEAAIEAHAPDLMDEVRGVADGAGVDPRLGGRRPRRLAQQPGRERRIGGRVGRKEGRKLAAAHGVCPVVSKMIGTPNR